MPALSSSRGHNPLNGTLTVDVFNGDEVLESHDFEAGAPQGGRTWIPFVPPDNADAVGVYDSYSNAGELAL